MYRTAYEEKRKQWHGIKTRPLYHSEVTLGEILLKSMKVNGAKLAQVSSLQTQRKKDSEIFSYFFNCFFCMQFFICLQISDDSGIQLTYNEIRTRTIRAAVSLQKRGYKPKQVFGIIASNSSNLAPIVFASFCIGCPINVLDTSFGKHEITHMLNITKPCLVFCDVDVYDKLVDSLTEVEIRADIITMNGRLKSREYVEDLFVETGLESTFM